MAEDKLRFHIGINIATARKEAGLTQAGLAQQINYTDKAVSKWERGESTPDVATLVQLSKLFGISVNDLLKDPDALPEEISPVSKAIDRVSQKALKHPANKNTILGLCTCLVWFVTVLVYVILSYSPVADRFNHLAFAYAIPINAIVALSLRSAWHDFRWHQLLISGIAWGSLLSLHLSLLVFLDLNLWKIYLLGIPGQIAIFLWFRIRKPVEEEVTNG